MNKPSLSSLQKYSVGTDFDDTYEYPTMLPDEDGEYLYIKDVDELFRKFVEYKEAELCEKTNQFVNLKIENYRKTLDTQAATYITQRTEELTKENARLKDEIAALKKSMGFKVIPIPEKV